MADTLYYNNKAIYYNNKWLYYSKPFSGQTVIRFKFKNTNIINSTYLYSHSLSNCQWIQVANDTWDYIPPDGYLKKSGVANGQPYGYYQFSGDSGLDAFSSTNFEQGAEAEIVFAHLTTNYTIRHTSAEEADYPYLVTHCFGPLFGIFYTNINQECIITKVSNVTFDSYHSYTGDRFYFEVDSLFRWADRLTSVNDFDTEKCYSLKNAFLRCPLQNLPQLDMSNMFYFTGLCAKSTALQTIPEYDASNLLKYSYLLNGGSGTQLVNAPNYVDTTSLKDISSIFMGDNIDKIPEFTHLSTRAHDLKIGQAFTNNPNVESGMLKFYRDYISSTDIIYYATGYGKYVFDACGTNTASGLLERAQIPDSITWCGDATYDTVWFYIRNSFAGYAWYVDTTTGTSGERHFTEGYFVTPNGEVALTQSQLDTLATNDNTYISYSGAEYIKLKIPPYTDSVTGVTYSVGACFAGFKSPAKSTTPNTQYLKIVGENQGQQDYVLNEINASSTGSYNNIYGIFF